MCAGRGLRAAILTAVLAGTAGACTQSARIELAAADALDALAIELSVALAEYHADLERADDQLESAVIAAFIERTCRDAADAALMQGHAEQFTQALARLRADRRVAYDRYDATRDNLAVAGEVARDLRGLALAQLTIEQDVRGYLTHVLNARSRSRGGDAAGRGDRSIDLWTAAGSHAE